MRDSVLEAPQELDQARRAGRRSPLKWKCGLTAPSFLQGSQEATRKLVANRKATCARVCRDRFHSRTAAPCGYLTTLLLLRRKLKAFLRNRWVYVVLAFDLSTPMGAHVACRVILAALSLWCSVLPLLL